jgi:hypothetical protein
MPYESEWLTRKKRIDSRLKALVHSGQQQFQRGGGYKRKYH